MRSKRTKKNNYLSSVPIWIISIVATIAIASAAYLNTDPRSKAQVVYACTQCAKKSCTLSQTKTLGQNVCYIDRPTGSTFWSPCHIPCTLGAIRTCTTTDNLSSNLAPAECTSGAGCTQTCVPSFDNAGCLETPLTGWSMCVFPIEGSPPPPILIACRVDFLQPCIDKTNKYNIKIINRSSYSVTVNMNLYNSSNIYKTNIGVYLSGQQAKTIPYSNFQNYYYAIVGAYITNTKQYCSTNLPNKVLPTCTK